MVPLTRLAKVRMLPAPLGSSLSERFRDDLTAFVVFQGRIDWDSGMDREMGGFSTPTPVYDAINSSNRSCFLLTLSSLSCDLS